MVLLPLLMALVGLLGPITAVRVLVCENGASSTSAVEVSVEDSSNVALALAAALSWAPDIEPQVHRRDGLKLVAPVDATQLRDSELIYLVRPGRHWMWPTGDVRHRIELDQTDRDEPHDNGEGVTRRHWQSQPEPWAAGLAPPILTRLANSPRLFSVENFIARDEIDALIRTTTKGASAFAMQRSTTGMNGDKQSTIRTSENSFDTDSVRLFRFRRFVRHLK